MVIWILEDTPKNVERLMASIHKYLPSLDSKVFCTLDDAVAELPNISEADVVLVDAQVPRHRGGSVEETGGAEFVARLREAGVLVRVLWHSTNPVPELISALDVEKVSVSHVGKRLSTVLSAATVPASPRRSVDELRKLGSGALLRLRGEHSPHACLSSLDILCQGYLAVVGATSALKGEPTNAVATALLSLKESGKECLQRAVEHAKDARDVRSWFAEGVGELRQAISKSADADLFWEGLVGSEHQPEVAHIRTLFDSLEKVSVNQTEPAAEWDKLVLAAHEACRRLPDWSSL
jgi:hypothetical protein